MQEAPKVDEPGDIAHQPPAALPHKGPFGLFYGWWIVTVSFLAQVLAGGFYMVGLAVYFLPVSRDLRLSRAELSFAFTLRSLEGGLDAPLLGYLIDRKGPRFMFRVGGVLAGIGFVLLAFTHNYVSFLVVFLGVLHLGFTGGITLPMSTVVNHWFARRRALAATLGQLGQEVGGAFLTPIVALVVINLGWRYAALMSGVVLVVMIPILGLFLRNTPESMGLGPDGDPPRDTRPRNAEVHGATTQHSEQDFTVREALRTRTFWQLVVAVGARLFSKSSLIVHLVPLLVWKGYDEQTAALLVGLFSLLQVPLRIGAALVADRWSMSKVPALSALAGTLSVLVLLFIPEAGIVTGVLFALAFALGESGNSPAWTLVGHYFGRTNYGTIRGSLSFWQSFISLPAPTFAGWVFDRTGSYRIALMPVACAYLISFVFFWFLQRPTRRISEQTAAT